MLVPKARALYLWASVAALVTAIGFGSAIVLLNPAPVTVHETAGIFLLLFLALAFVGARGSRGEEPRRVGRVEVAIALLVCMGSAGAAAGAGVLTGTLTDLPGVLLVALTLSLVEMIRISIASPEDSAVPPTRVTAP